MPATGALVGADDVTISGTALENAAPALHCPQCAAILGTPMRHSDGRLAFRLVPGSFSKRGVK